MKELLLSMKVKFTWFIAKLQIEPNQNHLLKNLVGTIFALMVGWSVVTLATVMMLLWPLKILKSFVYRTAPATPGLLNNPVF